MRLIPTHHVNTSIIHDDNPYFVVVRNLHPFTPVEFNKENYETADT